MCGVSTSNMSQWQFLVRKEGDQDWLPLESSSAEILEGRYQLIVQSDRPDLNVEVQIRHEYEVGGILQEVTQRRQQQTNSLGHLDLMASTYLPPGLWELRCREILEQSCEQQPPQTLSLQVLAQDFELESEWDRPELAVTSFAAEAISPPLPVKDAVPVKRPAPVAEHYAVMPEAIAGAASGKPAGVKLPVISKEAVSMAFRTVQGVQLPPMIYTPSAQAAAASPQLPHFLSSITTSVSIDSDAVVPTEDYLEFLRSIARSMDRGAVGEAFESLSWSQRFLSTLNVLAHADAESQPEAKCQA